MTRGSAQRQAHCMRPPFVRLRRRRHTTRGSAHGVTLHAPKLTSTTCSAEMHASHTSAIKYILSCPHPAPSEQAQGFPYYLLGFPYYLLVSTSVDFCFYQHPASKPRCSRQAPRLSTEKRAQLRCMPHTPEPIKHIPSCPHPAPSKPRCSRQAARLSCTKERAPAQDRKSCGSLAAAPKTNRWLQHTAAAQSCSSDDLCTSHIQKRTPPPVRSLATSEPSVRAFVRTHSFPSCTLVCVRSRVTLVHLRELPGAKVLGVHVLMSRVDGPFGLLVILAVPGPEGHDAGVQLA